MPPLEDPEQQLLLLLASPSPNDPNGIRAVGSPNSWSLRWRPSHRPSYAPSAHSAVARSGRRGGPTPFEASIGGVPVHRTGPVAIHPGGADLSDVGNRISTFRPEFRSSLAPPEAGSPTLNNRCDTRLRSLDDSLTAARSRALDCRFGPLDCEKDPGTVTPQRLSLSDGLGRLIARHLGLESCNSAVHRPKICLLFRKPRSELGPP